MKDYRGLSEVERARFAAYALDILNLAVYVENVSTTAAQDQRTTSVHINYVKYVTRLIRENPGLREFLDSLEQRWVGPEGLFERFRNDA